jgi:hypothetical protein
MFHSQNSKFMFVTVRNGGPATAGTVLDSDGEVFYDLGQLPRQRATHCWLSTTVQKTALLLFIPGGCVLRV